ncbi:MAG: Rieske 2Fe-2S domain-containing protein [Actinomycetota bacterium]
MSDPERFEAVDRSDAITAGTMRSYIVDGQPVVVVNVDGELHCLEDRCSHSRSELSTGTLRGHRLQCPLHGAAFDVRTGEHLGPPAFRGVRSLPVRIRDDVIEVGLEATESTP